MTIFPAEQNNWVFNFLTQRSAISCSDNSIQELARAILSSNTLTSLVKDSYLQGSRFSGWTTDGSKGYTDISTGHIRIGRTELGTEAFTLGYECINAKNSHRYREIGIRYSQLPDSPKNRELFAQEICSIEAEALYGKCLLALEVGRTDLVKDYYLEVCRNTTLEEPEKIQQLKNIILTCGVVYNGQSSAYLFYQQKRYDEIVNYFKKTPLIP